MSSTKRCYGVFEYPLPISYNRLSTDLSVVGNCYLNTILSLNLYHILSWILKYYEYTAIMI